MNVSFVLLVILFSLMAAVGGKRGIKTFLTLGLNFITFLILLKLISLNLDPLKITVVGCVIISSITLFYLNGVNKKTVSSFISVIIVVLLTLLITYKMGTAAKIQGFSREQSESISYLSLEVQLNFTQIVVCEILFGLLGAVIDVSISISSAMNELYKHSLSVSSGTLLRSGIKIGKDILGTMTNTLLFAYIGGFLPLVIWFSKLHYTIADIVNAKVFVSEVFQILCGGIGIILIIPVTAVVTSKVLPLKLALKT